MEQSRVGVRLPFFADAGAEKDYANVPAVRFTQQVAMGEDRRYVRHEAVRILRIILGDIVYDNRAGG